MGNPRTVFVSVFIAILGQTGALFAEDNDYARLVRESGVRGGLIVHLGCGDGLDTATLRTNDRFLVQGLDANAMNIARARARLRAAGVYGRVSVDQWDGRRLPYTDNLVNLLIAEEGGNTAEIDRVLTPGGVAFVKEKGAWVRHNKPRPADLDEWSHLMHGPDNNSVSRDAKVGAPYHVQWIGAPKWTRSHDHLASLSVAISGGGRLFYIADFGSTASVAYPARWQMVGVDAFNGIELWRRSMIRWEDHLEWGFRNGPPELGRRIVANGDKLYVTLGYNEPVSVLDAATGQTIKQFEKTDGTREILFSEGKLYLVADRPGAKSPAEIDRARRRGTGLPVGGLRVLAVDSESGKILWEKSDAETENIAPVTLTAAEGKIFYQHGAEIICLAADSGAQKWRAARSSTTRWSPSFAPTLVVKGGVVLSADHPAAADRSKAVDQERLKERRFAYEREKPDEHDELVIAYSAADGKVLWEGPSQENFMAPTDLLVVRDRLWTGEFWSVISRGYTAIRDIRTGEVVQTRKRDNPDSICVSHHRCHRIRATERYILLSRAGVELVDTQTGEMTLNHWIRGTCEFGILPANGLLYVPPHSCACYTEAKLNGFNALAAKRPTAANERVLANKPELGPAYAAAAKASATPVANDSDWPTFRHDAARSSATSHSVTAPVNLAWSKMLGGRLTAPVCAGGVVLVASVETHTVHALDAGNGAILWTRTVGGPVDSPPTIRGDRAIFGAADGYVYCVRLRDGELMWRFRAAPEDRRIISYGNLESVWPVSGSVLVDDSSAYFCAGRAGYLDGGVVLCQLNADTGELIARRQLDSRDPQTGGQPKDAVVGFSMPGVLPDVLSASEGLIYMRHKAFDAKLADREAKPHLFSPNGFLDDQWWHRAYWIYGAKMDSGFRDWAAAGTSVPNGEILSFDLSAVYGFGRDNIGPHGAHAGLGKSQFRLFSADKRPIDAKETPLGTKPVYRWNRTLPILGRALALAGSTLFVAGPSADGVDPTPGLQGKTLGKLWGVSSSDGEKLLEMDLSASPVADGMAVARGRIFMSLTDGNVISVGGGKSP